MIEGARASMLEHPGEFAAALTSWLNGGGELEDEAASRIVAETVLMHRKWLESKFKKPGAKE